MVRKMEKHRTVNVQVGEMQADIDEEIAPLIRELWKAGIDTLNSCQENRPGIVWIEFATADDAASFLNVVAEYDEGADGLYARITGRSDRCEHSPPPWDYHAIPEDLGLNEMLTDDDEIDEWHEGESEFLFNVSVRFPRCDFPAVLARLVRYNEEREKLASDAAGENGGDEACPRPAVADAASSVIVQAGAG